LSEVNEETARPDAKKMIKNLVSDQELIARISKRVIEAADKVGDQATTDLATRRLDIHQKNAWMLRVHLE
jgi:starvation-inducible DNA-binding protein